MHLRLMVVDKVARDSRYGLNVLWDHHSGKAVDPLNCDGAGNEMDIFVAMSVGLLRLPTAPKDSTRFEADAEALALMRKQFQRDPNDLNIGEMQKMLAARGIAISTEELKRKQASAPPLARPSFIDGEQPTFRGYLIQTPQDS